MSDYLVHLTEDSGGLVSIVTNGWLEPAPLGAVSKHPALDQLPSQSSCCLSEIPLDRLDRLSNQHGRYGVGFSRDFILSKHGTRVWYLDQDVNIAEWLFETRRTQWFQSPDPADPIWRLTPFIDYVTPNHRFEWEREWRVLDGLRFSPEDVRFLFGPDWEHTDLLQTLGLTVPIVDPMWASQDLIQEAFKPLPVASD